MAGGGLFVSQLVTHSVGEAPFPSLQYRQFVWRTFYRGENFSLVFAGMSTLIALTREREREAQRGERGGREREGGGEGEGERGREKETEIKLW